MTRHEHKVLTENCNSDKSIMVSWGYANRNQSEGAGGKCVEHSPTIRCLVCMVLYNRVGTKSMMYVWRIYPPAEDHPEWNAMPLSEIISHYRGGDIPGGCPVKAKGLQDGRGGDGRLAGQRVRASGSSSIPEGARGREVSFGVTPKFMTVHVVGGGKASSFKDDTEFNVLRDLVIEHKLTAICLHFGATVHMSGPVDMCGKQPHSLATRMVVNGTPDQSYGPLNVFEAYDMFLFYCKYTKRPA